MLDDDASLDTHQSVYREHLLEHLLIGELLKFAWLNRQAELEVSRPELDRGGFDIVLEANGVTRHVQLKSSATEAKTALQKLHTGLALKPSGCVIWTRFDRATLALGPFFVFGGRAGEPLPSLQDLRIAKHSKGNAQGEKKARPNIREVRKGAFRRVETVGELYQELFGARP
ncbi:MAG: hypothetical protein K2Y51_23665 [Gammaproteobacteria bacterium]|jgi:hypothetical protein|nr:hypothetical protein [Gammaproteobacteria bacterium]